jgi:hypothetical protein
MGTLIHKAIEISFSSIMVSIFVVSLPIVLIIIHSTYTWLTNKKVDKMIDKNVKVPSDSLITTILLIIGIGGPILISMLVYTYIHPTYNKSVQITEIKEQITIHDNKLTIKSLPEPYRYSNNKLNSSEPHDFKITKDDFYSDANPKLVDRDGNSYEITTEELNQLQK